MEISQYVVASGTAFTKCLRAAIKSKKSANDDDADDEEDDEEEDENEEEDKASRSSRWPEHSFDLRALPKAVQVCRPCSCTRTSLQDLTIERTEACLRNHKDISLRLFRMRYTASCGCLGGARE